MDNNTNSMTGAIIPAIIVTGGIVAATILVSPAVNKIAGSVDKLTTLAEKYTKNQAIDGCYQAGRVIQTDDEGKTIEIPETSWMNICLKEKGYK